MKAINTRKDFEEYLLTNYIFRYANKEKTKNKYETIYEIWKHRTAEDTYCIYEPQRGIFAYVPWNMVLNYIDVKSMYGVHWHILKGEEND